MRLLKCAGLSNICVTLLNLNRHNGGTANLQRVVGTAGRIAVLRMDIIWVFGIPAERPEHRKYQVFPDGSFITGIQVVKLANSRNKSLKHTADTGQVGQYHIQKSPSMKPGTVPKSRRIT